MSALLFGTNPFDTSPEQVERYHVIGPDQKIRSKSNFGFTGDGNAAKLSDREDGVFQVINTRDGSEYSAWTNGENIR